MDQRGGAYGYIRVGSNTYPRAMDRWWVYNTGGNGVYQYTIFNSTNGNGQQKGARLGVYKMGDRTCLYQEITPELEERLIGRTVTLSVSVEGEVYSISGVYDPQSTKIEGCLPTKWVTVSTGAVTAQWQYGIQNFKDFPFAGYDRRAVYIQLNHISGSDTAHLVVNWVKLELGDHATEFYPPAYNTELLKCQEYCQSFKGELAREYIITNDAIEFRVPMPAVLRGDVRVDNSTNYANWAKFSVLNSERKAQSGFGFKCRVEKFYKNGSPRDKAMPIKLPVLYVTATKANHGLSSAILNVGGDYPFVLSTEPQLSTLSCSIEEFEQK